MIPFPAEYRSDQNVGDFGNVTKEDGSGVVESRLARGVTSGAERRAQNCQSRVGTRCLSNQREQSGYLWFMGIADDKGDAGETGNLFRGTLRVTAGDNDVGTRIQRVDLADGVARLRVRRSRDRTGI